MVGESLYGLSNDRFGTLFLEKFKRKENKTNIANLNWV